MEEFSHGDCWMLVLYNQYVEKIMMIIKKKLKCVTQTVGENFDANDEDKIVRKATKALQEVMQHEHTITIISRIVSLSSVAL